MICIADAAPNGVIYGQGADTIFRKTRFRQQGCRSLLSSAALTIGLLTVFSAAGNVVMTGPAEAAAHADADCAYSVTHTDGTHPIEFCAGNGVDITTDGDIVVFITGAVSPDGIHIDTDGLANDISVMAHTGKAPPYNVSNLSGVDETGDAIAQGVRLDSTGGDINFNWTGNGTGGATIYGKTGTGVAALTSGAGNVYIQTDVNTVSGGSGW